MPLVFAAVTPHPPILIPSIGKEKLSLVENTKRAFDTLEQELYLEKPQTIIIISPHTSMFKDAFTVNAHTQFYSSYEQFGDFSTKKEWVGSPNLAAKIAQKTKSGDLPVQLVSEEKLDHGASVALYYLTSHLPEARILPVGYSSLTPDFHIRFGQLLKDVIMEDDQRIALIASGDLSHCVTDDAPGGFKKAGKEFDDSFVKNLESGKTDAVLKMDPKLVEEAEECGYRSTLILLGALDNFNYKFKKYSYECPLGVGYLVGQFNF